MTDIANESQESEMVEAGAERKDYVVARYLVVKPPHALDFETVEPDQVPLVQTFKVQSASDAAGKIECHVDWLEVSPQVFHKGETTITVRLLPNKLELRSMHQTRIHVYVPEESQLVVIRCNLTIPPEVDLVCIIDTIGDVKAIRERCKFVKDLIEEVQKQLAPHKTLRTAFLAYGDHNHIKALEHETHPPPLIRWDFDTPAATYEALEKLVPVDGQDFEAAFEDALAALVDFKWRLRAKRVMVTVGSRPPHPYKAVPQQGQLGSPLKYDWRVLLAKAQQHYKLESITVICPIFWPAKSLPAHALRYADSCWQTIGYTAVFSYESTRPANVARAIVAKRPQFASLGTTNIE